MFQEVALVAVEPNDLAVVELRAATIIRCVVQLADTETLWHRLVIYCLAVHGPSAMTDAVLATLTELPGIGVRHHTILIPLSFVSCSTLFVTDFLSADHVIRGFLALRW